MAIEEQTGPGERIRIPRYEISFVISLCFVPPVRGSNPSEMNSERKSSGLTSPIPIVRSQFQNSLLAQQNENSPSCLPTWERSNAWCGRTKEDAPYTAQLATMKRRHSTNPESSSHSNTELMEIREVSPLSRSDSSSIDSTWVESSDNSSCSRSNSLSNSISSLDDMHVEAKERHHSLEVMTPTELIDMLAKVNGSEDATPGFLTTEKPPFLMIEELTDVLCHVNANADSEIRWDVVYNVVHRQAPTGDEATIPIEHIEILHVDSLHSSFSSISVGSCGTDDFLDSFLLEFNSQCLINR